MVGGERLNPLPKQFPRGVGIGKIRIILAMEPGVLPDNLQPQCAREPAIGIFGDLEFRQSFFHFIHGQPHGRPERLERIKVIHGGAPDVEVVRIHTRILAGKSAGAKKNLHFRQTV
jgi:hypothetical protein